MCGSETRLQIALVISAAHARLADLGRLRVAWNTDFGQCPVSSEIRGVMRRRMAAMQHLFRATHEIAFDMGEADRCFDVIRAQNFLEPGSVPGFRW